MIKGAKKLVDECVKVKEGENVLIITDTGMPLSIAETLAIACNERGADAMITLMTPRSGAVIDAPPPLAEAMQKAQVIFMVLSQGIYHAPSTMRARNAGARGISLKDWREEDLCRGTIEANFLETKELIKKVGDSFRKAKEAQVTSPAGTKIYFDLKGRTEGVLELDNLCHQPGQFGIMVLEASISPKEGTAQGVIVCDASVTLLKPGLVNEPVRALVKDGMVTEISGGIEAKKLSDLLAAKGDPMVYNVAELGVGLNPMGKITGVQSHDEGAFGMCHIGIGHNTAWGGRVKAPTHFDFVMYAAKIELDGITLLENYKFNL